jgi:hypothetical protein
VPESGCQRLGKRGVQRSICDVRESILGTCSFSSVGFGASNASVVAGVTCAASQTYTFCLAGFGWPAFMLADPRRFHQSTRITRIFMRDLITSAAQIRLSLRPEQEELASSINTQANCSLPRTGAVGHFGDCRLIFMAANSPFIEGASVEEMCICRA